MTDCIMCSVNTFMTTLKQFLSESPAGSVAPSPANVDGSFTVGKVNFDNRNGLGATPMGANIAYMGAVAWMKPSVFRKLAIAADRSGTASELEELVESGKPMAAPFLMLRVDGEPEAPENVKVIGHEGRARADVFRNLNGDVPMPVQLHPSQLRARHLSPEFFEYIDEHGIQAEQSEKRVNPEVSIYFWNGQEVTP